MCATLYVSRTAGKPRRIHRTITSSIPCTVYCSAIGKKHHQLFWYRFCSQNQLLHGVLTCNVLIPTRWWYMFHGIVPRWSSRTASDWHDGNILCTPETHFVNSQPWHYGYIKANTYPCCVQQVWRMRNKLTAAAHIVSWEIAISYVQLADPQFSYRGKTAQVQNRILVRHFMQIELPKSCMWRHYN